MKQSVNGAKNTYSRGQLRAVAAASAFYLSDAGYETSRAGNLAQRIIKALAEHPDLIVTNLHLPDMNAVNAAVILKQDPATSTIPIVVLAAMPFGEWKAKALRAGVAKYLIKPSLPPKHSPLFT